jgi:hypothetical protein
MTRQSSVRILMIMVTQEISDADFEALQAKMFGGKDKAASGGKVKGKKGKA